MTDQLGIEVSSKINKILEDLESPINKTIELVSRIEKGLSLYSMVELEDDPD